MTETLADKALELSSHIPLDSIFIGKRRRQDYGDIEELKKDLRDNGQIQAITICPPTEDDLSAPDYNGQPWSLIAGGRRVLAARQLGWTTIRAMDRERMDEHTRRVLELAENLKRKDMSFIEVAQAKQEMFLLLKERNPDITQAEVAKQLGQTPKQLSQDLAVAELLEQRPELKNASSKKAVLRQGKLAAHFEARVIRDEVIGSTKMLELNQRLETADARDWLRRQPTAFADLILTDLPYGIDHFRQGHKTFGEETKGISEYDDAEGVSKDLFVDLVPQMIRVTQSKGWIVTFMAEANYEFLKELFSNCCLRHCEYRDSPPDYGEDPPMFCQKGNPADPCIFREPEEPRWYWYRPNSQNHPRFPDLHAKNVVEPILVFNRGEALLTRECDNLLVCDAEYGMRIHAMQKPHDLCKDLISRFTLPGETVLDPCFGSGAILAAGAAMARNIWGCEMNDALRGPALGYVAGFWEGAAPRVSREQSGTDEFVERRLELVREEAEASR